MAIKEPLSIIGYGASTINGTSAEMSYAMQQADQKFFKKHDEVCDLDSNPVTVGFARYINEKVEYKDRFVILGEKALIDAVKTLDKKQDYKLNVLIGLPEFEKELLKDIESKIRSSFENILKNYSNQVNITFFYGKHSVCSRIIQDSIEGDSKTIYLIGGIDSYQDFDILLNMQNEDKLLTVENNLGIVVSEGAGFIVVMKEKDIQNYNFKPVGQIIDCSVVKEKEKFSKGQALTKVIKNVSKKMTKDQNIERIHFDLNSRRKALEFGCSYIRNSKLFSDEKTIYRLTDKSGDVGCATIPLLINNAIEEVKWGDYKVTNPLLLSSADEEKSALLLEIHEKDTIDFYTI